MATAGHRLQKLEAAYASQISADLCPGTIALMDRLAKRAVEFPESTDDQKTAMRRANAAALNAARAGGSFDANVFLNTYEKSRGDLGLCGSIAGEGLKNPERTALIREMIERCRNLGAAEPERTTPAKEPS